VVRPSGWQRRSCPSGSAAASHQPSPGISPSFSPGR
jgi:hypothetical protein